MKLIWRASTCPIFGACYQLDGLTGEDTAHARRHGSAGRFIALATIKGKILSHTAKTMPGAMRRLQSEIDRQSIGLLGVDRVTFGVMS
jgi:hypothetical protein